jgi:hypothetical protein
MYKEKVWLIVCVSIAILIAGLLAFSTQTPGQASVPRGSISGVIWQDFCRADCVAGSSLKRGNALVSTAEARLAGIKVNLAKGKCAEKRPVVTTVATNGKGFYLFASLKPGFYCVSVDSRQNSTAFPKPGYWTRPAASGSNPVARYDLKITGTNDLVNKSFGWNYK